MAKTGRPAAEVDVERLQRAIGIAESGGGFKSEKRLFKAAAEAYNNDLADGAYRMNAKMARIKSKAHKLAWVTKGHAGRPRMDGKE